MSATVLHFCTYFDRRYLAQGLVLYRSLERHCPEFRLRVFCMDDGTKAALDALALPHLVTISLEELEAHDPALRSVKDTRSMVEYYWTATPAICLFCLEREPELDHIIHLDADLEFYADPALLVDELGDGSVLLTPHRPAPEFEFGMEEFGGFFNVEFELFRADPVGLSALSWWHERCIEWCYKRWIPFRRYGDQAYLDEMARRFEGVVASAHPGGGLAPWNVGGHRLERRNGGLLVDGQPLVFHHFTSLELHANGPLAHRLARRSRAYRLTAAPVPLVWTAGWRLTESQLDMLWEPHVARISAALAELEAVAGEVGNPRQLRPRRAAFHVLRRHLPGPLRSLYWQGWMVRHRIAARFRE